MDRSCYLLHLSSQLTCLDLLHFFSQPTCLNLLHPFTQLILLPMHLTLDEARLITQACRHYQQPYTAAMKVLQMQYRQPH